MKKTASLMKKWMNVTFESSTTKTEQFNAFARDFRSVVKEQIQTDFDLISFSVGHFYIAGFIQHKESGKYVYFSTSDVRHFPNAWVKNVLIRTAKHEKDYTGGPNHYTTIEQFLHKAMTLVR